jgi:hypothetical protein
MPRHGVKETIMGYTEHSNGTGFQPGSAGPLAKLKKGKTVQEIKTGGGKGTAKTPKKKGK